MVVREDVCVNSWTIDFCINVRGRLKKKGNSKEEFLSPGLSYFLYITPSLGLGPAGWLNSHKHA